MYAPTLGASVCQRKPDALHRKVAIRLVDHRSRLPTSISAPTDPARDHVIFCSPAVRLFFMFRGGRFAARTNFPGVCRSHRMRLIALRLRCSGALAIAQQCQSRKRRGYSLASLSYQVSLMRTLLRVCERDAQPTLTAVAMPAP